MKVWEEQAARSVRDGSVMIIETNTNRGKVTGVVSYRAPDGIYLCSKNSDGVTPDRYVPVSAMRSVNIE